MEKSEKILLGLLLIILISIGIIIYINKKQNGKLSIINEIEDNDPILYYRLSDKNIYLHGASDVYFKYNNQEKRLNKWFLEDDNFLDKFLKSLKYNATANDGGTDLYDGGTILYRDGGTKEINDGSINVFNCNTLEGNQDIHIGKNLRYEGDVCKIKKEVVSKENLGDVKSIYMVYPKDQGCNDNLEVFYENASHRYLKIPCAMIIVEYKSGLKEEASSALRYGTITISDLDKYDIDYHEQGIITTY